MSASEPPLLLVEDDEALRHILARHLRGVGFLVVEAASAEEATEALQHGLRPGLVILDVNLPGDTGWDLLRGPAIAEAGTPPVIVASALTIGPRRLAEFGVAGYLPKPFALETLVAAVQRTLVHEEAESRP
jgi:two-component system, OmpR family, phosphate regulon response regulator OmpR